MKNKEAMDRIDRMETDLTHVRAELDMIQRRDTYIQVWRCPGCNKVTANEPKDGAYLCLSCNCTWGHYKPVRVVSERPSG